LALLYALLDSEPKVIRKAHLEAALAVWRYCEASVNWLFAEATMSAVQDRIMELIRNAGNNGIPQSQLYRECDNNTAKGTIPLALRELEDHGKINKQVSQPQGKHGRPMARWFLSLN
jgi:hypothetical protein